MARIFRRENIAGALALSAGLGALIAGATISALASYFARTVVTPSTRPARMTRVIDIKPGAGADGRDAVVLSATKDTTVPGRYSLVFDNGAGLAIISDIRTDDPDTTLTSITRTIEKVFYGNLRPGIMGSWTGFLWPTPAHAGYSYDDVVIAVENGLAPAWVIEPAQQREQTRDVWAVMVHGRGSKRTEGIRALQAATHAGLTSLLITYRNDGEAPPAVDGRYGLGATEWRDVEAAVAYAVQNGARSVVIFGWSMGGAVTMQFLKHSRWAKYVSGAILTGPVLDWVNVLAFQARANRLPQLVSKLGAVLLSSAWARKLTGLATPVDLKALDWVAQADKISTPLLIMHSVDDDYVPYEPSKILAEKRPELISFVRFTEARHTREWNNDPNRWNAAVATWLEVLTTRSRLNQIETR